MRFGSDFDNNYGAAEGKGEGGMDYLPTGQPPNLCHWFIALC